MRSAWALLGAGLRANIIAGTRLALFLRVNPLQFRISAGHYAALVSAGLLLWALGGMVREGAPHAIDMHALALALARIPILLLVCVLAASAFGRPSLAPAFAVLLTALDPVFEVVGTVLRFPIDTGALGVRAGTLNLLYIAWAYAAMLRAQVLLSGWHMPRSLAACALFALLLAVFVLFLPRNELWAPVQRNAPQPLLGQEDVFHLQAGLLEERIAALRPERPGIEDLYFIGVAPYALQDTFAREMGVVNRLMDERFDTRGRSLVLVNHPASVREQPIATVTNLRTAIERIGATMNPEEDVLFLFLTTHGTQDHKLVFEMPPLRLRQLSPPLLARVLGESGIKWKIVVISACYSGAFVEALKDDHTLVVTAADDSHSSFGCEFESDFTWFSKAFFDQALRRTFSFTDAFRSARDAIGKRERGMGLESSNPQVHIGVAMKAKIESLARRFEVRGAQKHVPRNGT